VSRAGYSDDPDPVATVLYEQALRNAMHGKRGKAILRDLADALDAMPVKELGAGFVKRGDCVCAIGALAAHRGVDLKEFDVEADEYDEDGDWSTERIAEELDAPTCIVRAIVYGNDELGPTTETPSERWARIRSWVGQKLARWEPKP